MSLSHPLSHVAFVAGLGFLKGEGVCWEWAMVFVLSSWVSWVNFWWVVVPIWVWVAVVGGSDLGLVCGLLRGLVCDLLVGLVIVISLHQMWWLMGLEQLLHRKCLSINSEALAGTRGRGRSTTLDLQVELDLLSSPKDHLEFTIVRESIRKKLKFFLLCQGCSFPFQKSGTD
ncbi:hypothetical protein CMV_026040, partial [Castanea mollissima]